MTCYTTLRGYKFPGAEVMDVRGAAIYGPKEEKGERKPGEEKLGHIEDVIFEPASGDIRYVVVNTGGPLLSKWHIIPGEALRTSATHKDGYETNLTSTQVETFPRYDPESITSPETWEKYEEHYRSVFPEIHGEPAHPNDERWVAFQDRLRRDRHLFTGSEDERKAS
jgi:hypothetical protein